MIGIVNYDAGNIKSVKNGLDYLNIKNKVINNKNELNNIDGLILPGVGAFGSAVKNLKKRNLFNPLKEYIKRKNKFLGICLGMQLLFEESEESPDSKGLSVFKGKSIKFKKGPIPNIGWRKVKKCNTLEKNIIEENYYYFLHSFYVKNRNKKITAGDSEYNTKFTAAINYKKIWGVQFHPEKSSENGLKFLKDWSNL